MWVNAPTEKALWKSTSLMFSSYALTTTRVPKAEGREVKYQLFRKRSVRNITKILILILDEGYRGKPGLCEQRYAPVGCGGKKEKTGTGFACTCARPFRRARISSLFR